MIKSFSFSYNHHLPSTTRRTFQILFYDCGGPSGCLFSLSGIHENRRSPLAARDQIPKTPPLFICTAIFSLIWTSSFFSPVAFFFFFLVRTVFFPYMCGLFLGSQHPLAELLKKKKEPPNFRYICLPQNI